MYHSHPFERRVNMGKIQSSVANVQQITNHMEGVADSISNLNKNPVLATRTTVAGNKLAEQTIVKQTTIIDRIMVSFKQEVQRLKKVSNEFAKTDQNHARLMS